jgi:hypothetical protein
VGEEHLVLVFERCHGEGAVWIQVLVQQLLFWAEDIFYFSWCWVVGSEGEEGTEGEILGLGLATDG